MKFSKVTTAALLICGLSLNAGLSIAQRQPVIEVSGNVLIDLGSRQRSTGECFLAINPANPNHLLAGVLTGNPHDNKDYATTALASFDGGKTWRQAQMPMKQAADPWGIILPDGAAVLGDIGLGEVFRQAVYYTPDGGLTWRAPVEFGDGHDHDMFVYDDTGSRFAGTLYLLTTRARSSQAGRPRYELFLARSTDKGKTFPAITTHAPFPNLHFNAKTPVILSDGTLAIPVVTLGSFTDNQNRANRPETVPSWLVTSSDGGKAFSAPLFITDGAGRRHNGLAVNKARQWQDRLYYVYPGARRNGLYLTLSADRGVTWSAPRRLDKNTDANAFTDLGAVAVSANGVVGVLWIDRIDDPARKCQYTYFTASTDGGETFRDPVRVSNAPSCPGAENGWIGQAWPQGGDYGGLVARPDGSFLALWSDARQGTFQLYTAEIKLR